MSPLVARHATVRQCRESIERNGLLASPSDHGRPCGVYVYSDDGSFDHPTFSRGYYAVCRWSGPPPMDVWEVTYIGRVGVDQYVVNGLILTDPIEPQHVTLVTGNK